LNERFNRKLRITNTKGQARCRAWPLRRVRLAYDVAILTGAVAFVSVMVVPSVSVITPLAEGVGKVADV
jgi:hypothetical protein